MLIDFSKYSSLKIGAPCEVGVIDSENFSESDAFSESSPSKISLSESKISESKFSNARIIGKANNLLVSPNARNLWILDEKFSYINDCGDFLEIGALTSSSKIVSFFKAQNLGGAEFLKGLPGSLGGIIKMNAGLKDGAGGMFEICNILSEININGAWVSAKSVDFGYRRSGINGVIFGARILKNNLGAFDENLSARFSQIRAKHPKKPSCGSCFKNPQNDFAGRLLEAVGLKGHKVGGAGFSEQHANFLVNYGGASFEDAILLIELAKKRVFENFGIALECEVQIFE